MRKCIACGQETGNDDYSFCKTCFKKLRDSGKIIQCEDCGEWYIAGTHCVCEIPFAQCPKCGRWHDYNDPCICQLKSDEKKDRIYKARKSVLTDAEKLFKEKLEKVINLRKYDLQYQMSLRQIVEKTQKWRWANELNRDLDFCIVRKDDYTIVACIEYDDTTHDRPDRIERDKRVEEILEAVGIRLIRIKRNDDMSLDYLRAKIDDFI